MIERYLTLDGQILELQDLSPTERSYLDRCITAFDQRVGWFAFSQLVEGTANPLLAATCGRVTQTVWAHPLYQTIRDLEDRLGLEQGHLAADTAVEVPGGPYAHQRQPMSRSAKGAGVAGRWRVGDSVE